jgi:hypothetical protein
MPNGDENLTKDKQAPLGSPGWKQVWPEGIWPTDIPGGNFFALGFKTGFNVNPSSEVTTEFEGLHAFDLLMAGTGGESFSFFGNLALESHGGGAIEPEFERIFAQYNHPSHYFNLTVGRFEPRGIPFAYHRSFTHQVNHFANEFSTPAGLARLHSQEGIEIWGGAEGPGRKGGFLWSFGVVNGNFVAPAAVEHDEGEEHAEEEGNHVEEPVEGAAAEEAGHGHPGFDTNSEKDFYFLTSYKIGGLGVFGGGAPETPKQTQNWRDDHFTIGGYLYRGTGPTLVHGTISPSAVSFLRAGGFFDWSIKDVALTGGYQFHRDQFEDEGLQRYTASIATSEIRYVPPYPWVVPFVRFEAVNPNFGNNFTRTTIAALVMIRANVLLDIQGFLSSDHDVFDDKFRVGMRFYF